MTVVNIIGTGPNGLAAGVVLARSGVAVRLYESGSTPGGGARSAELIESGTVHDICSAVHPAAFASEFFRRFGLTERVSFVVPEVSYAQAGRRGGALLAYRDLDRTVDELGAAGPAWRRLFAPLAAQLDAVADLTGDHPLKAYRHPATAVRLGMRALAATLPVPLERLAGPRNGLGARDVVVSAGGAAAALLSGVEGHAAQPLGSMAAAAVGLSLGSLAHSVGWPIPIGGSQAIVDELVSDLMDHGAELHLNQRVGSLSELPAADATLFDTSVPELLTIAGDRVPDRYRRSVGRFRSGPGMAKVDVIMSEPVPWTSPELARAGTIHLGGSRAEVYRAFCDVKAGRVPERPFILASQPTAFDPGRTATGRHVLWAYTAVPSGANVDPEKLIMDELERYAPGIRDLVIGAVTRTPREMEAYNPNYRGGDIYAGALSSWQLLSRPLVDLDPWRVGDTNLYLCSSAAVPGPGVHGMVGYRAAQSVLRNTFKRSGRPPELGPRIR